MEAKISILCNTYNQVKYIGQALDSFLAQKVNVPIEILIHDDSSTDGTTDVIKQYEAKYPTLIKPIYQTENQFSQGIHVTATHQLPRVKGKYIAFCEGDDYWTDPDKLQIQYDYMEAHEECSLCCHAYDMVDKEGELIEHRNDFSADCSVPISRLLGNQLLVPHFATMMIRSSIMKEFKSPFLGERANDKIYRLFCAAHGDVHYLNRNMSCYRRFVEGSWTVRVGMDDKQMIEGQKRTIPFMNSYDCYTHGRFHKEIEREIDCRNFEIDLLENNYSSAIKRTVFHEASAKRKAYIILGVFFPKLITKIRTKKENIR